MIAIVDHGLGNLLNVQRALAAAGAASQVSARAADLEAATGVVLPGVGAFGEGMRNLERAGLVEPLQRIAARGTPLLGICLGMQLLMDESEEFGRWEGLHLIPGRVRRFDDPEPDGERFKIPQIGWNHLLPATPTSWSGTILDGLDAGAFAYFVHSYYVEPADVADCVASAEYGRNRFCAVIARANVMGCQFHPEKSAAVGLRILENFARIVGNTGPL
jgi:glutamine amidotransferase